MQYVPLASSSNLATPSNLANVARPKARVAVTREVPTGNAATTISSPVR